MAAEDSLDAVEEDNAVGAGVEKPTSKEYFTLEGSILI